MREAIGPMAACTSYGPRRLPTSSDTTSTQIPPRVRAIEVARTATLEEQAGGFLWFSSRHGACDPTMLGLGRCGPGSRRRDVPNLEERVAALEGRVQEHAAQMSDIRQANAELRQDIRVVRDEMNRRFDALDGRFVAIDGRFAAIDGRFVAIDGRFVAIDGRFVAIDRRFVAIDGRFAAIDGRFDAIDRRFDSFDRRFDAVEHRFAWLVGLMVTGFLATIGTVAGAFWGVLQTVR
ncbi:MAG: hypothetical protein FJW14_10380 [Acidimicrobiia bacterium]|nr:hypothetical protein [Acidimicrobiia bacterium]